MSSPRSGVKRQNGRTMKEQPAFIRHEEVYHAARQLKESGVQQSGLSWLRLRGLKKICLMNRQKNGGFPILSRSESAGKGEGGYATRRTCAPWAASKTAR